MSNPVDEGQRPLTVDEAADALGLSAKTIRRRVKDGSIESVQIGPTTRIPRPVIERLQGFRNGGERWVPVATAAAQLGVPVDHIHRRHPHHLETRRLGDEVCVRESDLERWEQDGLPYPEWEAVRAGDIVPLPEKWATLNRAKSPHGETAFVALRQLQMTDRELQAGDILSADEPIPDGHLIAGPAGSPVFAELPIDRGVLGLLRASRSRIQQLEAELAKAKAAKS